MSMKKYLIYFGSEHNNFRLPEFLSLAKLFHLDNMTITHSSLENSPMYFVEGVTEEEIIQVAQRSVTIKVVLELWGYGTDYEAVIEEVMSFVDMFPVYVGDIARDQSFKFLVDAYHSKIDYKRKMALMQKFFFLDFKGKVKMDDPDNLFWIEEVYNTQTKDPESPKEIFFGKQISAGGRDAIITYDLKKREYLGTTSMDAELSLIASNMGLCRPGTLIMDPFTGTGSFLVTCAHYGSHVMGGDMDIFVLRGKENETKNIYTNFYQYGIQDKFLGAIRFDNSKHDLIQYKEYFDAIITDPPYGVREGARKVGVKRGGSIVTENLPEGWHPHISQTISYPMCDVLSDLFDLAARTVKMDGRLIFWLPTLSTFSEADTPVHPCFVLEHSCMQGLTATYGRVLLVYTKTKNYDPEEDKVVIEYDPEKSYSNYASHYLNDPTRDEMRYQKQD